MLLLYCLHADMENKRRRIAHFIVKYEIFQLIESMHTLSKWHDHKERAKLNSTLTGAMHYSYIYNCYDE